MTATALHRAVWRWHFYAGLVVLPFLLWLAVTGGLYLYKPEIERAVYGRWSVVAPIGKPLPLDRLIGTVEAESGATVVSIARPADSHASWRITLANADAVRRLAFVDPYRAVVLGTTTDGGIMRTVRDLHSLIVAGPIGNALIEIVAGWTVLLVLTGLYLWWPHGSAPALGVRGPPRSRTFWRDLHASTGIVAGAVVLFLAATGMPWTGVAGKQLQTWVAVSGLGRPKVPGPALRESAKGHDHGAKAVLAWALQEAKPPAGKGTGNIGAAAVERIAAAHGLHAPWTMTLPAAADAPYLVTPIAARAEQARALYIEASSGRVLQDARYASFGAGARAIEWSIAVHQGQEYGEPNRLLMLAGCIAIVVLAVSAPVMWWKRRRPRRIDAPPRTADRRGARGLALLMLGGGALFPLTGVSIALVLAGDLIGRRVVRRG